MPKTEEHKEIGTKKYFDRFREPLVGFPNFVEAQTDSFEWLLKHGLKEIFKEFSPIKDYSDKKFELEFTKFELGEPKFDEYYAKEHMLSYDSVLRVMVKLKNKTQDTVKEQEIFLADFPLQTRHGTFIINGVERVIVPQLARSFGVFFTAAESKGKTYFGAKIIPSRGAWVEIESEQDGALYVKIDRKRKFPITSLLRILGARFDKDMYALLERNPKGKQFLAVTLGKDPAKTQEEAYMEIHKKLRDGDLATPENAKNFVDSIFSAERYDLSKVGRYRFNQRFGMSLDEKEIERRTLSLDDIVKIISHILMLNADPDALPDDIDHLGFRRVRYVGELLQQRLRVGMSRMKRNIQDRMSTVDAETSLPIQFINPRPLQASIKEFFTTNQLSQFMQQENVLSELEHLRTLSALGPVGLTRERAGFEVRDVHPSHYGRLCPIHTPEGPNIGLILHLSAYARINEFGMIESPYAKVVDGKVTKEVKYLNAFEEEKYHIAHSATRVDAEGNILDEYVEVRTKGEPNRTHKNEVHYIDVATNQAFSIATSLIPFLEHNDANRALMGSNMQKQAVPCIVPERPLVATGIEGAAARDTGRLILAKEEGMITYV
ncbi:MAG TPA: DNA-directed RNA polymerase subunit beta, partial [Candidatus Paceibacterota bacterium]